VDGNSRCEKLLIFSDEVISSEIYFAPKDGTLFSDRLELEN
jgi:hypothetical protein